MQVATPIYKYIAAYCDFPRKTFSPVYGQYYSYPERWKVLSWEKGAGEESYFSLSQALEGSYDRYHDQTV